MPAQCLCRKYLMTIEEKLMSVSNPKRVTRMVLTHDNIELLRDAIDYFEGMGWSVMSKIYYCDSEYYINMELK